MPAFPHHPAGARQRGMRDRASIRTLFPSPPLWGRCRPQVDRGGRAAGTEQAALPPSVTRMRDISPTRGERGASGDATDISTRLARDAVTGIGRRRPFPITHRVSGDCSTMRTRAGRPCSLPSSATGFRTRMVGARASARSSRACRRQPLRAADRADGGGQDACGFLPSLIALAGSKGRERRRGVHTLYISPLKALAVDIARIWRRRSRR